MRRLLVVLSFLFISVSTKANDVYVAASGAGSQNGSSCANALVYSYFDNQVNWTSTPPGSGSILIGPGTTVHLCGTFTGAAGSTLLTFKGSGTSSAPVTVLFESGARLSATYWASGNGNSPGGGAINLNGQGYLVVDGGSNGVIENTDNGSLCTISPTPSPCFHNDQNSLAISAVGTHDVTIKNLAIQNIYVHTSTADNSLNIYNDGCVMANLAANVTIDHVTAHDMHWCFSGDPSNLTISNSEVYHADHGVAFGASRNVGGLKIYSNHFHDFSNWDTSNDAYHHDYIHLWDHQSGTAVTDGVIYNNTFDGLFGNCCTTAFIYLEESIQNVSIFNNTFIESSADTGGQMGVWLFGRTIGGKNNAILNNFFATSVSHSAGNPIYSESNESGLRIENNIDMGAHYDMGLVGGTSISTVDYNVYDDTYTDYGQLNIWQWNSNPTTRDFATWKSECACDSHSIFATKAVINVDSGGHPQPGSPAIGAGANLTSLATGALAPLAFDKNGVPRPSSGNWDIGAFQASGSKTVIDYGAGFSSSGMAFNGSAALNGTRLELTNGGQGEAGSGWYTSLVNVQSFTTDFTFQLINPNADGITFAIQNSGLGALGAPGGGLGYGVNSGYPNDPGIPTSVAVKYDLFQNAQEGNNSTGLYTDGAAPTVPATTLGNGVNLHSGDTFKVHIAYDGTTLTMTITDTVTNASFTTSWPINIPSTVGANTAYVGFTGGTGGQTATQEIITWTYSN